MAIIDDISTTVAAVNVRIVAVVTYSTFIATVDVIKVEAVIDVVVAIVVVCIGVFRASPT